MTSFNIPDILFAITITKYYTLHSIKYHACGVCSDVPNLKRMLKRLMSCGLFKKKDAFLPVYNLRIKSQLWIRRS